MRGGRACERERATREEAAGGPFCRHRHSNSLPSPFTISILYIYTYIPHFSGDWTIAAAAAVESQALHSYINVYIIDASKPPSTESSRQCVGCARRVVFGGGMFERATFKPSTEID